MRSEERAQSVGFADGPARLARSCASMSLYTLRSVRSARKIDRITSQKIRPMRMVGVIEKAAFAQKSSSTVIGYAPSDADELRTLLLGSCADQPRHDQVDPDQGHDDPDSDASRAGPIAGLRLLRWQKAHGFT